MDTPGWLIPVLGLFVFVTVASFFICGSPFEDETNNPFTALLDLITHNQCDGLAGWLDWALFMMTTVPLLVLLFTALKPLFNNAITAIIASIALITTALVVLINFLFG